MSAEEILAAAADLIEQPNGWCQGSYHQASEDGAHDQYCLMGAIAQVAPYVLMAEKAEVFDAIRKELGSEISLTFWNDVPGRTAIEVATMLRNSKRQLVTP